MLLQFIIALFVLRTKAGFDIFNFISGLCRDFLGFANNGVTFLTSSNVPKLGWFLTSVVPPIIFFVSFVQMLYYWGVLQWFIGKFAVFFFWSLRVSGAEAVVAAASPFIGQGESAMLIRPFIAHLTQAELHQVRDLPRLHFESRADGLFRSCVPVLRPLPDPFWLRTSISV
jgi:CNT family concentrative nucleoside transporter